MQLQYYDEALFLVDIVLRKKQKILNYETQRNATTNMLYHVTIYNKDNAELFREITKNLDLHNKNYKIKAILKRAKII